MSIGKSDSEVEVSSRNARGDIDTTSVGAYVRQQKEDGVYLSGQVSYSRHKIESVRQLLLDGLATADYDANTLSASGEVGKRYGRGSFVVEPNVSLRLANTRADGLTESGGPGALTVSDSRYNSRRLGIGVRVVPADKTAKFRPHLSLGFEREFGDSKAEINNNVTGVSGFNVSGSDLGKNIFRASVGAEAELGERLSIVGEIGLARRKNQDSRSIYGGLKYGF